MKKIINKRHIPYNIKRKHIYEGAIVPIYENSLERKNYIGDAELIKCIQKATEQTQYILSEKKIITRSGKEVYKTLYYNYDIWTIKFVSGNNIGFITNKKISYLQYTKFEDEQ